MQDAILEMNEDFKPSPQVFLFCLPRVSKNLLKPVDKTDEVSLSSGNKSERKRSSDSSDKDYNLTSEQIERDSKLYGHSYEKNNSITSPKEHPSKYEIHQK